MLKLVLALIFAVVVAIFALQNAQTIDVNFLRFTLSDYPVAGVIIGMLAIGGVLGVLFSAPQSFGRGRKIRELESQLRHKENELAKTADALTKLQQESFALKAKVEKVEKTEDSRLAPQRDNVSS